MSDLYLGKVQAFTANNCFGKSITTCNTIKELHHNSLSVTFLQVSKHLSRDLVWDLFLVALQTVDCKPATLVKRGLFKILGKLRFGTRGSSRDNFLKFLEMKLSHRKSR